MSADVSAQAQSRFPAYARRTTPTLSPTRHRTFDVVRRSGRNRTTVRATITTMTNPELIERVRELRQRGRTPKEIARALGLPPAAVAPLIRAVAAAQPKREAPLVGCWVNRGWAAGLTVTGHADWPGAGATAESDQSGLVTILVARDAGSSVSICGYLVDVWCLG